MSKTTEQDKVMDCISSIIGQTEKDIQRRTGLTLSVIRKVLKVIAHDIEWKGDAFRWSNAGDWCEAKDVLPPWPQAISVRTNGSKKGYELFIHPPRIREVSQSTAAVPAARAERKPKGKGKPKVKKEKPVVWAEATPVHAKRKRGQNYFTFTL